MNHYVFDTARSYGAFLRAGAQGASPQAEPSARWAQLIGLPSGQGAASPAKPGAAAPASVADEAEFIPTSGRRFHWGNSEQILVFGRFNRSLTELKQAAKSPAEAWAAEQFDVARDAFRRGLDREALGYLQRSMEGGDGHESYALEYRVHLLQGVIYLGGFQRSDPTVLDLAKAEQAFTTAARCATCDHRVDAGWSMLAAGWAAYAQGQMGRATVHTEQAIALQPSMAEAYFQAAKILCHTRQPDLARPYLVTAVELDPAFAVQAAVDGDFARFAQEALTVVEARRQQVGQVASRALQEVVRRAKESGILKADGTTASSDAAAAEDLTAVATLVASTTRAMRTNSLYGYLAAENLAAQAGVAFEVAMLSGQKARQIAEDTLQTAEQLAAQLQAVQIGSYRLGASALDEFNRATALIAQGRAAVAVGTVPAGLEAEQLAKRVVLALNSAAATYKTASLEQAEAERVALLEQIEHPPAPRRESGDMVRSCAVIGAVIAVVPGGYFNLFLHGMPSVEEWPTAMLRLFVTVAVAAGIGGLVGLLISQGQSSDSSTSAPTLDARKTALDETIARLREFSVENLTTTH